MTLIIENELIWIYKRYKISDMILLAGLYSLIKSLSMALGTTKSGC